MSLALRAPNPRADHAPTLCRRRSGPSKPDFERLLLLSGKTREEVGAKLGLDDTAMHNLVHHRVTAVERWAPVFAKCVLLSRRGLLKLLNHDACEESAPSVGQTIYQCLLRRGEATLAQCREALLQGWLGWEKYRLTPAELEAFFAGTCKEAEQVADFLVKLGQATDLTNLFSIFTR